MAIDATLTTTEKNGIFELVEKLRLDPAEFEWTEDRKQEHTGYSNLYFRRSILKHRPTGYYFAFGGRYLEFSPGEALKVENEERPDDPDARFEFVWMWLRRVRQEHDAPDLWASIGQAKELAMAASSPDIENRPFKPNEVELIKTKLDEIKRFVLDGQSFDANQAEFVEREFTYLKEASQRLGRKDWVNVALGGMAGLIVSLALDPEKARGLMALAGTALQSLWGVTTQGLLQ